MPQSERGTWKNKADFVLALISYGNHFYHNIDFFFFL